MVAYGVSHVFDFTDPSVAIDTAALAHRECFTALSSTMPQSVNMHREACLSSLLSLQGSVGNWSWGLGLAVNGMQNVLFIATV